MIDPRRARIRIDLHDHGVEDLAGRLRRLRECEDFQARLQLALREQANVLERARVRTPAHSARAAMRRYY